LVAWRLVFDLSLAFEARRHARGAKTLAYLRFDHLSGRGGTRLRRAGQASGERGAGANG
jgi:hypothetical protein